jgi:hypothetical protein
LALLAAAVTAVIVGFAPQAAFAAYPTSSFGPDGYCVGTQDPNSKNTLAITQLTVTWYNRSVGVQGYIESESCGAPVGNAQVRFDFYQGGVDINTQTRTAQAFTRLSFNFTVQGTAPGGINQVFFMLCGTTCDPFDRTYLLQRQ